MELPADQPKIRKRKFSQIIYETPCDRQSIQKTVLHYHTELIKPEQLGKHNVNPPLLIFINQDYSSDFDLQL